MGKVTGYSSTIEIEDKDIPVIGDVKKINIENWAHFLSYYRYYVDKFAVDVLGMTNLFPFQRLLLRVMGRYPNTMIIACRGLTKSYISAIFLHCMAVLYPGIKIGIVSGNGNQARMVIKQKIQGELYNNDNVARDISGIYVSQENCVVEYKNGSSIRAISLGQNNKGDSARGWRFQLILVDEARLVKSEVLKTVVEPMKNTPRENAVKIHQKYPEAPLEEGRIIYISSAWLKTCDLYQRFLDFYSKMTTGSKDYFVASLDWRVGVDAGLFTEASIVRAKEDPEMTSDKFIYEYEGVFVGSSNESYYPYELTSKCRVLDTCELKQPKNCKYNYIITHDVAVSTKKNSDNACTHVIKLIPKVNGTFDKQLVYTITLNGASLAKQRDLLRELIHLRFPNTVKLVIDAQSAGQGLLSLLEEPWSVRDEKGEQVEYPPLVCDDDEEAIVMLPEAIPMIRGIKATVEFNIDYYPYMRSCFEDRSLKLLVNSSEKDADYKDEKNPYTAEEYLVHVEHDILVEELNNIKRGFTENGRLVYDRIIKTNKRDRATSLMYGLSVVSEMEKEGKAHAYAKEDENELDYLVKYIF